MTGYTAGGPADAFRAENVQVARPSRAWLRILLVGLALWVASVVITYFTENTNLLPTVILLGSFLVPVTFVAWAFEHADGRELGLLVIAQAFLVGGLLGVFGAAILETYLLRPSPFLFIGVGLIEELVKIVALLFVARHLSESARTMRNGLVLGATVGFGFAALESAGYALNALITVRGLDLQALVETEILRGLLSPVGHGLWTAILGAVVFAASRHGRWKITVGVVLAYLGVSLLHALWDSVHVIAIALTMLLTDTSTQQALLERGYLPRPTQTQANLMTAFDWIGLIVISAIGVAWLITLAYRAGRGRSAAAPASTPRTS